MSGGDTSASNMVPHQDRMTPETTAPQIHADRGAVWWGGEDGTYQICG